MEQKKILVVMSYHETMDWVQEMEEGIEDVLQGHEVRYFYMDTRNNYDGGPEKAREAYELFQTMEPDGVIAGDDNAQSMFVVPYLKNKVQTPVMFCGVNADPAKYGYPAANVSGILERAHIKESIALIQQLDPSVKTISFLMKESPTAQAIADQAEKEKDSYPAEIVSFKYPKTLTEVVDMTRELTKTSDSLFLVALEGIVNKQGKPMSGKRIVPLVAEVFRKPTTSPDIFNVRQGLLCTVSKTGMEQGSTAARMLLEAMSGTPVSEIPVTQNRYGKRVINVTEMKELGLTPDPIVLRGAQLVKTDK